MICLGIVRTFSLEVLEVVQGGKGDPSGREVHVYDRMDFGHV